jgi:hypothetical protein
MISEPESAESGRLRCSFCNKSQDDVEKMISGPSPNLYICDECVDVCVNVIADDDRIRAVSGERTVDSSIPWPGAAPIILCPLCRMPMAVTEGVTVGRLGLLCPTCVNEVKATVSDPR